MPSNWSKPTLANQSPLPAAPVFDLRSYLQQELPQHRLLEAALPPGPGKAEPPQSGQCSRAQDRPAGTSACEVRSQVT